MKTRPCCNNTIFIFQGQQDTWKIQISLFAPYLLLWWNSGDEDRNNVGQRTGKDSDVYTTRVLTWLFFKVEFTGNDQFTAWRVKHKNPMQSSAKYWINYQRHWWPVRLLKGKKKETKSSGIKLKIIDCVHCQYLREILGFFVFFFSSSVVLVICVGSHPICHCSLEVLCHSTLQMHHLL